MASEDSSDQDRMIFVVVAHEHDDGSPAIDIMWQPRPMEWATVWTTGFASAEDRDLVYDEMWDRRARWSDWGNLAMFAGPEALNDQLLREWGVPSASPDAP